MAYNVKHRHLLSLVLATGLAISPSHVAMQAAWAQTKAAPAANKTSAGVGQLADNADRQVALLIRAARQSKDPVLRLDAGEAKPFWTGLKRLHTSVAQIGNGLQFKDESFHKALAETVSATAAVQAALELSGSKDPSVRKALSRLEDTIGALQGNFSKAAARQKQGGKLSAAEKQKLETIKTKQSELEARLKAIEPKVKNNPKAMRVVREIRERSVEVRNAGNTLGDFLAAMVAIRIIDGILWGGHWWWGPWGGWCNDFSINYIGIYNDILIDMPYDWAYYDALQAEIDDAILEDAIDTADLDDAEAYVEEDLADLSEDDIALNVEGVDMPEAEDFDNPDFGLDEDAALQPVEQPDVEPEAPEPELPDIAPPPEEVELPDEGNLPAVEDIAPEPEPMPVEPDIDLGNAPMDIEMPDLGDAGMDDLGFEDAGFDDLDGGFDFD
ncbi:hypothetical protein [Roseibium sp.]|uniref:hypothetical protein n=1 Tax=Roseibium sp. TaxID=1936156 RepID=UPI003D09EEEB